MHILMTAYACNPVGTGEHWLGWGWVELAARNHRVTLVTPGMCRTDLEPYAEQHGIEVHYVDVPEDGEDVWGLKPQIQWQKAITPLLHELHARHRFTLAHHVTFHSFRVPVAIAELPIPTLLGPIAGGESVPPGFGSYLGPWRWKETIRAWVNRPNVYLPSVYRCLKRMDAVWVSNRETFRFLPGFVQEKATVVMPNVLRPGDHEIAPRPVREPGRKLQLLYVGNCVATRSIPLVIDALKRVNLPNGWELNVLGKGPALSYWKETVAAAGMGDRVIFGGEVPHAELQGFYNAADALVFPGLRDSGGSSLLEAMSKALPVICLNWAGPAEMTDAESGIGIPVRSVDETLTLMAQAFERVVREPEWAAKIGLAGRERALKAFSWESKRVVQEATYQRLAAMNRAADGK